MQSMENCVNIWCEDTCLWIFMGLFFSYTSWKFFWVSPHSSDAMQRNGAVENSTYDSLSLSHSYHLPKWRQSQVISHDDNSICSFWVLELAYFHLIEGVRQWCQEQRCVVWTASSDISEGSDTGGTLAGSCCSQQACHSKETEAGSGLGMPGEWLVWKAVRLARRFKWDWKGRGRGWH